MGNVTYHFGYYSSEDEKIPNPENLKSKDSRADPVAKAAVFSANNVIDKTVIKDLSELSVIVVNREGCMSHVKRISDGLLKKVARQGFFARGGPQTLATYTALALNSHGAAYTLVGEESALEMALHSALYLIETQSTAVILTVVTQKKNGGFDAISSLIQRDGNSLDPFVFKNIYKELASLYS